MPTKTNPNTSPAFDGLTDTLTGTLSDILAADDANLIADAVLALIEERITMARRAEMFAGAPVAQPPAPLAPAPLEPAVPHAGDVDPLRLGEPAAISDTDPAARAVPTDAGMGHPRLTEAERMAVVQERMGQEPEWLPPVGLRGPVSDGYHTFDELYRHRHALFLLLCRMLPMRAWRARERAEVGAEVGEESAGWFLAGLVLPFTGKQVSYHLPEALWPFLDGVSGERPEWDGHTSAEVAERLLDEATAMSQRLSARGLTPPMEGLIEAARAVAAQDVPAEARDALARALRPFGGVDGAGTAPAASPSASPDGPDVS